MSSTEIERPEEEPNADEHRIRLEAALVAGEIGTWTWDVQRDLVRGDPNLDGIFGLPPSTGVGRPLADYLRAVHPDDEPQLLTAINAAIAGLDGDRYAAEYRVVVAGRERWICARGIVDRDAGGVAVALPGVVLDITRQKELELERRRVLEAAERQARVFDTTLSAITDFAYIFDLDGRFIYVNKALLDLWGLRLEDAIGKNFFDLQYPEALASRLQQQIQQVIDTRTGLSDETPYTSPTGSGGYYEYIFSPVFAADGSVEVVAGSTRDVSARKHAENSLRRQTAQFETLLNNAPLGVLLIDADFRIREVNPTAQAMVGVIPRVIGEDFADVSHRLWSAAYAGGLVRVVRQTLESGGPFLASESVEPRLDWQKAEPYEWQINRIPLPDGTHGVVCYFRDISTQLETRRRLETADRQKDEFLAMLAHELRNPLAPIRSATELLSRTLPAEHAAHAVVGVVQRQVGHLTRLVDDLLDVARITQGRIELRRRPLELAGIIAQALETVGPLLQGKRHSLVQTPSGRSLQVSADPARLVQCVANILTNAAKYTDAGGEICIRLLQEGDEAIIAVTDNGVGISSPLLPRLFDLFVQSDRTLDRAQGGLGIGLAVVKRLVEMHDGRVSASSAGVGQGATFEIRLPLIDSTEEAAPTAIRSTEPRRRILIVDDNEDAANSLAMLLELDGHEVKAVYTAGSALACATSFEPDAVLLDIGLPDMDGYEVARRIRALPRAGVIRLIALTGYGQADDRERALEAGFDDHLVKPVELSALERALFRNSTAGSGADS
ncbi:MAG: PAS domain-containing protein [bacterium]